MLLRALQESKVKFVMLSGHITALEFYHFLFANRKGIIVLDDVNILESEQNLNMLKACLSDNSRVVQYQTSSSKLKVPNKFVFEGKVIMILNKIPSKNESLKAVQSRVLTYKLKMGYETKMSILEELSKQDYEGITTEDKQVILKWIKDNTNPATENLNLRLLFTIYEMYKFDKDNWTKLADKIIEINQDLELILQGMTEWDFCYQTGKSRRTYFDYKKKLKAKI